MSPPTSPAPSDDALSFDWQPITDEDGDLPKSVVDGVAQTVVSSHAGFGAAKFYDDDDVLFGAAIIVASSDLPAIVGVFFNDREEVSGAWWADRPGAESDADLRVRVGQLEALVTMLAAYPVSGVLPFISYDGRKGAWEAYVRGGGDTPAEFGYVPLADHNPDLAAVLVETLAKGEAP